MARLTISPAGFAPLTKPKFDLIIVGAGPAGLALACEFLSTSVHVGVFESGGSERSSEGDALNEIETVGQPRAPHEAVGCRALGGASSLWTGRCGELDPIDYHARPWLPATGWPIDGDDLATYSQRAGKFLGIAPTRHAETAMRELRQSFDEPPFDTSLFKPVIWQFSTRTGQEPDVRHFTPEGRMPGELLQHTGAPTPVNVAESCGEVLRSSQNVQVFTSATVREILVDPVSGHAIGIKARGAGGDLFDAQARSVVLAAGGIQNPRLLLASRSANPNGLGNDHDMVGRFLCDHFFSEIALFPGTAGANVRRRLGSRWHPSYGSKRVHAMGIRLSEEIQRNQELLNASVHLVEYGSNTNPLSTLARGTRNLKGGQASEAMRDLVGGLSRPAGLASSAFDRLVAKRPPLNAPERSLVGCVVEQELQRDSRVGLSDRNDRYGMPVARVDWRISEREFRTVLAVEDAFHREAERLGFGSYERPAWRDGEIGAWRETLVDLAHPSCSTRMSADPAEGVVDANCEVHGVPGLYVAGSSVFATNGHMNPTQTLVALAIRLADHIKDRINARHGTFATPKQPRRVRFGFVGGGHRVETVYAPVMNALAGEVEVCGVATRTPEGAGRIAERTGWSSDTDLRGFVQEEKPDALIVAVPPGAADSVYPGLVELGIPLLLETPACWNERVGRDLLRKSNRRQLLVAVAEQFPFLPEFELQRKLISLGLIGRVASVVNDFAVYDYHGIALLRALLGRERKPVAAQGSRVPMGADETWTMGTLTFDDGSFAIHRFSPAYEKATHRNAGAVRVYGTAGTLLPGEARFGVGGGEPLIAPILREEEQGDLRSLRVETPDGVIRWDNPAFGFGLTDEQIAVASLVRSMADAVRFSGAPAYPYWSALEDVELNNAIGYSAHRGGRRVALPASPQVQKVLMKTRRLFPGARSLAKR